jgi:hypothetical protein
MENPINHCPQAPYHSLSGFNFPSSFSGLAPQFYPWKANRLLLLNGLDFEQSGCPIEARGILNFNALAVTPAIHNGGGNKGGVLLRWEKEIPSEIKFHQKDKNSDQLLTDGWLNTSSVHPEWLS